MELKNTPELEVNELEDLYNECFDTPNDTGETLSLVQPSPLKHVDSFITYGAVLD